ESFARDGETERVTDRGATVLLALQDVRPIPDDAHCGPPDGFLVIAPVATVATQRRRWATFRILRSRTMYCAPQQHRRSWRHGLYGRQPERRPASLMRASGAAPYAELLLTRSGPRSSHTSTDACRATAPAPRRGPFHVARAQPHSTRPDRHRVNLLWATCDEVKPPHMRTS